MGEQMEGGEDGGCLKRARMKRGARDMRRCMERGMCGACS